jgi:hypothetical protein
MLNINLSFEHNAIHVLAKFILNKDVAGICFALNETLEISKMTDENGNRYIPLCEDLNLRFHPKLKKYTITPERNVNEIMVEYRGSINNRSHNIITNDCVALNWYSTWYPQKPLDIISNTFSDTTVIINNIEDYKVIKGVKDGNIWAYKPLDYDVNVIAIRNYNEVKYDSLSFSYLKNYENTLSEKYKEYLRKIIDYYRNIYKFETLPPIDIVVLPNTNPYDGYTRGNLIVLGGFCGDITRAIRLIAHEIAHVWCTGADVCSWEDWLNETFAEWSALLFIFDNLGISEFEKIINSHRKDNLPPIKTVDGSRPANGVHDRGTILLYELYLLHGKDLIVELLQTFSKLKNKTTADFLSALRNNNLSYAANYIKNNLDR